MTADAYVGQLDAISASPELREGLCVGNWSLFDAVDDPIRAPQAAEICTVCPVLPQCAAWSAQYDANQLSGIVAGVVRPWQPTRRKAS